MTDKLSPLSGARGHSLQDWDGRWGVGAGVGGGDGGWGEGKEGGGVGGGESKN